MVKSSDKMRIRTLLVTWATAQSTLPHSGSAGRDSIRTPPVPANTKMQLYKVRMFVRSVTLLTLKVFKGTTFTGVIIDCQMVG